MSLHCLALSHKAHVLAAIAGVWLATDSQWSAHARYGICALLFIIMGEHIVTYRTYMLFESRSSRNQGMIAVGLSLCHLHTHCR
jgi:hypothetical protein